MLYLLLPFIILAVKFISDKDFADNKGCASKFVYDCLSLLYFHNKLTPFY